MRLTKKAVVPFQKLGVDWRRTDEARKKMLFLEQKKEELLGKPNDYAT